MHYSEPMVYVPRDNFRIYSLETKRYGELLRAAQEPKAARTRRKMKLANVQDSLFAGEVAL